MPAGPAVLRAVHALRSLGALRVLAPIPARVSPKDTANECTLFEPRTALERETTAATRGPASSAASHPRALLERARRSTTCSSSDSTLGLEGRDRAGLSIIGAMALLSASNEAVLRDNMSPASIPLFALPLHPDHRRSESGHVAKQVLDEVASLNDRITSSRRIGSRRRGSRRRTASSASQPSSCSGTARTRGCGSSARRPATSSCRSSRP